MTDAKTVQWLSKHDHVFGELREAVAKTSEAAGQAGRLIAANVAAAGAGEALAAVRENARRLLAAVRRARRFPPFPDEQTAIAFSAGLERWADASETLMAAVEHRDVPEIHRAERALDAGLAEFLRMAEALRRATGQQHPTISGAT